MFHVRSRSNEGREMRWTSRAPRTLSDYRRIATRYGWTLAGAWRGAWGGSPVVTLIFTDGDNTLHVRFRWTSPLTA